MNTIDYDGTEGDILYDVDMGRGKRSVRASSASGACLKVVRIYGWRKSGDICVDAKTRGMITCEMWVETVNCRRLLVATVRNLEDVA